MDDYDYEENDGTVVGVALFIALFVVCGVSLYFIFK